MGRGVGEGGCAIDDRLAGEKNASTKQTVKRDNKQEPSVTEKITKEKKRKGVISGKEALTDSEYCDNGGRGQQEGRRGGMKQVAPHENRLT